MSLSILFVLFRIILMNLRSDSSSPSFFSKLEMGPAIMVSGERSSWTRLTTKSLYCLLYSISSSFSFFACSSERLAFTERCLNVIRTAARSIAAIVYRLIAACDSKYGLFTMNSRAACFPISP